MREAGHPGQNAGPLVEEQGARGRKKRTGGIRQGAPFVLLAQSPTEVRVDLCMGIHIHPLV